PPNPIALRIGPVGQERMWVLLFPPPRPRKDTRTIDAQIATHLGVLAGQASFALEAAARFPAALDGAIDPLTDLYDGAFCGRTLEQEIQKKGRNGGPGVAVVTVVIDAYPAVQEVHGALVGERLLVEAARVLVRGVREVDLVARSGPYRFEIM